jgi:hypothetical protein
MALNSKFYTLNFEKEIVVQGRNTTFLSIEAVQSEFSAGEKLFVGLYVQPQTFSSKFEGWNYTPAAGLPTPPSGTVRYYFRNTDFAKNYDFAQASFDAIQIGDDVKAISMWRRTLPGETALGNGPVDAVKFTSTVTDKGVEQVGTEYLYYIEISDANFSANNLETYLIQVGKWETDNNWYINQGEAGGVAAAILKRGGSVTYTNAHAENQFDGQDSIGTWPAGGDYRTRIVGGLPNPWSDYIFTTVSPFDTPRLSYRIDFDGDADSHLKICFLIVKTTSPNPLQFLVTDFAEFAKATVNYGQKLTQAQLSSQHRIDYQETHFFGYQETPIRTNRTTYQNEYASAGKEIYDDRSSYAVLKSNPKLTGNIKLTVDSGGSLWLNSIDANQELSDARFKKYAVSSASTYQRDLYYFLDQGKFPKDTLFSLYQKDDQYLNTKRSFSEQYDNFYNYGVEQLNSRFYDEDFSFFAPLWLRKEMPDFFVIFRLDHPLNPLSYEDSSNPEKFAEFFKDARIIKTFDMRESSPLGNYLRKIVNDPRWNERPLQVSFDSDVQTTWFGIDYTSGTISGKGEFLYDFWKTDNRILDFEETITNGFERNGIVSTNLINLEFLFDDSEATLYTINRYFGLYVKENQLAEFEIVPEILGAIPGQSPQPKIGRDGEPYSLQPFIQTNSTGVKLPVDYYHNPPVGTANTSATPEYSGLVNGKFPLPSMVDDPLRIFYVKDRNGIFKRVNKLEEVNYGTIGSPEFKRVTELQLFDTSENISDYGGITQIASQIKSDLLGSINAQLVIKVSDILQSGKPLADYETIDIEMKKLSTERRDYYYQLLVTAVSGSVVTFDVLVPDYAGATPTIPTEYYATKIVDFASTNGASIDSYLQFTGSGPNATAVNDTWDVKVYDGNIEYAISSNTGGCQLTFFGESNYVSYRWRLEANPIGLSPGESWDYPVLDPAGRDYTNTFCNNGTPEQVAQAIANCINSFENIIVKAKADGDTVYLRSKEKWEDGNSISLSRNYVVNKSVAKNLGFYEHCNVLPWTYSSTFLSAPAIDYITPILNEYTDVYTERYFYFNVVVVGASTWSIEVRADVDPLNPTLTGTSSTWFVSGNASHAQNEFTVSWSASAPSFSGVYKFTWGRPKSEQFFITGRRRSRGTARVPLIDGQRFYTDKKTAVLGNLTSGSFTISGVSFPNSIYQGAPISGTGIAEGSRVLSVDALLGTITISKPALSTTTGSTLKVGELSILNNTEIFQQWFQTQKENFSRLKGWDVQGKFVYAPPFIDNKIEGYSESSILQIEKDQSEFYYTKDARIIAYNVYRPSFGIFSVLPIKSFDVDTYFSDYSYAPTLELFRYYNREELKGDYAPSGVDPNYGLIEGELLLNMGENYDFTLDTTGITGSGIVGVTFDIEVYDTNTDSWKKVDEIGTNLFANPSAVLPSGSTADQLNSLKTISLNTYYPLYFYDFMEVPNDYKASSTTPGPYNAANPEPFVFPSALAQDQANDGPQYTAVGTRNFVRKRLYTSSGTEGRFSKAKITNIKVSTDAGVPLEYPLPFGYVFRVQSSNYYTDENIKNFAGFQSLTDFLTDNDVQQIQQYTEEGSFEKFTYQMLLSEYDRLRENQQKDLAVKSKVVPSILKWVQEGTDARDNYYRLNNSTAFGITNFSPDSEVDFTEPLLLTHEFPYLSGVPKDYPEESLEGSRSYFFQKLSDVAYNGQSWYDLLTTDNTKDWFSKYFVVGYPNEISPENNLVPKSRDERYTFFKYINGLDLSQTLFRGAKINVIDYDTTVVPKTPINESDRFDLYKFAAIARFVHQNNFEEEKPVQIEVINNEKFKTILIIITVFVQDYRLQSGLGDYSFFYYAIDQLRNSMQSQYPGGYGAYSKFFNNSSYVSALSALPITSPDRKYPMEVPYTAYQPDTEDDIYRDSGVATGNFYSTSNPWAPVAEDFAKALEIMMPRQLFLGGGRIELDDTRLGGKAWFVSTSGVSSPNVKLITQPLKSVDGTSPYPGITSGFEYYPVFKEVFPTIDNYRTSIDSYLRGDSGRYIYLSGTLPANSTKTVDVMTVDGTLSELSVASRKNVSGTPNPYTYFLYDSRRTVEDIRLDYLVFSSNSYYTKYNALVTSPTRATVSLPQAYSALVPPAYPPYVLSNAVANMVPNTSQYEVYQTHNLRGGSLYYKNKKNFLSYANIAKLFNESSNYILYRKIDETGSSTQATPDFELRFVPFDKIKKLSKYYYKDDTDKPLEYEDVDFIGYDLAQTNEQEFEFRHRGMYEPKTLDVIGFWARENESFTRHFEKDYILSNTHINSQSSIAGLMRNYFYNKVSDFEVLEISRTSAYKSLYPLIGEISIDRRNINAIDSSWDAKFYRKYESTLNFTDKPGTSEMQETKVFLAGKAMVVPKTFEFQTFNASEVTYIIDQPKKTIGVTTLAQTASAQDDLLQTKPILKISMNLRERLLRALLEGIIENGNFDEFSWFNTLGIPEITYTTAELNVLKRQYLEKNIIPLYEVESIVLYSNNREGLPVLEILLDEADKVAAGYREDQNVLTRAITEFTFEMEKTLDTKAANAYSVSAVLRRV